MSLKDDWKDTGKGIGKTFAGLGKSIAKSVKVGLDAATDETPVDENGKPLPNGLRESWTEVGHSFGTTGKSLGRAAAGTAKKVIDKVDEAADGPKGGEEDKTE